MTRKEKLALAQLAKQANYEPIVGSCMGKELKISQVVSTVLALMKRKCIISLDTGLGKTVIASSLINLVMGKGDKSIFILKRTTLDEILVKLKASKRKDLNVGYITNEGAVIDRMVLKGMADSFDIIVISSDALSNEQVNKYIYSLRESIKIMIVDEMHLFSNLESIESRLIDKIGQSSEYFFTLSATPFQRDIIQLINTLYMLDTNIFDGKKPRSIYGMFTMYENGILTGYRNLDKLKQISKHHIINVTRDMLGIKVDKKCTINWIRAKDNWLTLKGNKAFRSIKGDIKQQPFFKLCEILSNHISLGRKGIVYINLNEIKSAVYSELTRLGYRVGIVDGSISIRKDRDLTKSMYRKGELDILIINTPESADLEGDFVIFYELTLSYNQMIGRINRSFNEKTIFIDFIVTKNTYEEDYFMTNIYDRVMVLYEVCGKRSDELKDALGGLK